MLLFETERWKQSPTAVIAGVDEAGRGCLAGPVVAGAVSMSAVTATELYRGALAALNDSKKLSASKRERFFDFLTEHDAITCATGWCSSEEVDTLNILSATHLAMRRALENLPIRVDHALVDGLPVKHLPCASDAIVKGDSRSLLIAAASIIAKVSRDRYMIKLDVECPGYGFADHKGYGTNRHISALHTLGACDHHRRSFRPVQDVTLSLPGFDWS